MRERGERTWEADRAQIRRERHAVAVEIPPPVVLVLGVAATAVEIRRPTAALATAVEIHRPGATPAPTVPVPRLRHRVRSPDPPL
jgi:hypothetical protein